jgi:hypothetical protein
MKNFTTYGFCLLLITLLVVSCSNNEDELLDDTENQELMQERNSKKTKKSIPDYGATVFAANSSIIESGNVDFTVFIAEYNGFVNNINSEDITLLIQKPNGLDVTFNQSLTTLNNQAVVNANWEQVSETNTQYLFKYIGSNGVFPGGSGHRIGFNASLTCSGNGDVPLSAEIGSNSGGQVNTVNDLDSEIVICFGGSTPDFAPGLSVLTTEFESGAVSPFNFVTDVKNYGGVSNGTPVEIRIVKSSNLNFSYDNALTSLNGVLVNNNEWAYDGSHPSLHKFQYIGNGGVFVGNSMQSIGIKASYTCVPNTIGTQPLKATVKYFSGGEENNQNNNEVVYLSCVN